MKYLIAAFFGAIALILLMLQIKIGIMVYSDGPMWILVGLGLLPSFVFASLATKAVLEM